VGLVQTHRGHRNADLLETRKAVRHAKYHLINRVTDCLQSKAGAICLALFSCQILSIKLFNRISLAPHYSAL